MGDSIEKVKDSYELRAERADARQEEDHALRVECTREQTAIFRAQREDLERRAGLLASDIERVAAHERRMDAEMALRERDIASAIVCREDSKRFTDAAERIAAALETLAAKLPTP